MIKLSEKFITNMLHLPESGMGYQLVDVKEKYARELKRGIVYNSDILRFEKEPAKIITSYLYEELTRTATKDSSLIEEIRLVSSFSETKSYARKLLEEINGKPAKDSRNKKG